MTEWGVVGVVIALVGLMASVIKPAISLTEATTKLTVMVGELRRDLDEQSAQSRTSHQKLWDKNNKQDEIIQNHEVRIARLEDGG